MPANTVRYIVTCKTNADVEPARRLAEQQGGKIDHVYTNIPGFVVDMPSDTISTFSSSSHVESVELDQEVRAS